MKPIIWTWSLTPPPHPEEARSAVSKDGRWHHISFVPVLRDARKSALLRTRFSDGSYDSNLGNAALGGRFFAVFGQNPGEPLACGAFLAVFQPREVQFTRQLALSGR